MKTTFLPFILAFLFGCASGFASGCASGSGTDKPFNANNVNNNANNLNNTNNVLNNVNNTNPADTDGDGVPDDLDVCPGFDDGLDADADGVPNGCDGCPGFDDGLDTDADGRPDGCDACPQDNPDDTDDDGVCDSDDLCAGGDDGADDDLDGVPDFCDRCAGANDGLDTDADGVPDFCDRCAGANDGLDTDADGVPDGCDLCPGADDGADDDLDGVPDGCDLCPGADDGADGNGNGIPDGCEDVGPGSYEYTRIPLGGMAAGISVAAHPDNSYFVIAEYTNRLHVYDVATATFSTIDLSPGGSANIYFRDIAFSPAGDYAVITGMSTQTSNHGVAFRFDDAAWRANRPATTGVVAPWALTGVTAVVDYTAVEFGLFAQILLLGHNANSSNRIMYLVSLDPVTGAATYVTARNVGADAVDMTAANNVYGDPGAFIVGGPSGAFTAYYTEVTGTPEFTIGPGNNNLGNSNHTDAHPGGDYALVISSSGDAIYKFEAGMLNGYSDAPRFSTRRLWNVVFQPNGLRALVLGQYQNISGTIFGGVFEYRHGHYSCVTPFANCEITEVSIPSFGAPPWNATSGTVLQDAAWRSDCDGGLIVGGSTAYSTPYAFIARFQIINGAPCTW
ncbi:MAG: hypothetical protein CVU65_07220 [Deltaproteobacteria bacterium HGW-Deltaproteobacteria-22]|jgi:hypothetical protein|nr:MAG: hypothetical protein CVU65_07220 [Deltaproteobacteria bacterium HGW-Deltaproteobacteria-22]